MGGICKSYRRSVLVTAIITSFLNTAFMDANVVVQTDEQPCVCGRSFKLTCEVTHYTTVAWMIEGDVVPIAKCIKKSCKFNPTYDKKYTFTYDIDKQFFILTFINVTMANNGSTLICSDGDHSDSWTLSVRENEPMLTEDAENGIITMDSGCNYYSNNDVSFVWIKEDTDGNESEFDPKREKYERNCSNSCGKELQQQKQCSETINAETTADWGYILKCEVFYRDRRIKSDKSLKRYQINEQDGDSNLNGNASTYLVLVIIPCFITISIAILLLYKIRRKNSRSHRQLCIIVENNKEHPDEKNGEIAAQTNEQLSNISEKSKEEKNTDYTGKAELAECRPLISCSYINKEPDVMQNMKISPDFDDVPFTDMTVIQGDQCPQFYPSVEGITTQNPEPQPDLESKIIYLRRYSKSGKNFTI